MEHHLFIKDLKEIGEGSFVLSGVESIDYPVDAINSLLGLGDSTFDEVFSMELEKKFVEFSLQKVLLSKISF